MGNNNKFFVAALAFAIAASMTGCNGSDKNTETTATTERISSHDYGYQQLCKANEVQYEEIESPIEWQKNYSYVDKKSNASVYGFYDPIKTHDYYAVTRKGYVYNMTVSDEKAEIECVDNIFNLDEIKSIWGVDGQAVYAVWYSED